MKEIWRGIEAKRPEKKMIRLSKPKNSKAKLERKVEDTKRNWLFLR